jgi:threonine dehydrogenase-like Zn-dependent dehydrogenase
LIQPGKFDFFEVDEEPGPKQVLVKISGCGLCNWELNFFDGSLNFQGYPHKLGHEFAGEIYAAGPDVKNLKVGDKVSVFDRGFGGFAQFRLVDETNCELLAGHIDPKYAMGEPQKCIVTVLRAAMPETGDYAAIVGAGPMGLWCVQGLSGNTLAALIAVDVDDDKLKMAREFGASHTINSLKEDAVSRISEITRGHMADFVIEGTGIPAVLNQAQCYLRTGRGRLILMSSHHDADKYDFRKAIDLGLEIRVAPPPYSRDERDDFRRAVRLINNNIFLSKPLVTHEYKLSEIQRAFEDLKNKPKGFIKGVVVPE